MLHFHWPLCTIWVCVISHAGTQMESNVNYLEILKYPTELPEYDFIKKPLKLYNNNAMNAGRLLYAGNDATTTTTSAYGTRDDGGHNAAKLKTNSTMDNPLVDQQHQYTAAFLLKWLTNIAQQISAKQSKSSCGKSKSSTRMSTTAVAAAAAAATTAIPTMEPSATTMATSKRSLHVYYEGQQPEVIQAMESFNILEQLKLDEKKQHKLKLQSQQVQDNSHNQQLTGLPQVIWDEPIFESLGKAGKKKKKKRKKRKKQKPPKDKDTKKKRKKKEPTSSLLAQPAHLLFASPHFPHHTHQHVAVPTLPQPLTMTTKKPQHHFTPFKKIKYILRKNSIFKKKKKEYLNHLKQVLYPFVKFIAFFTVLNPFTLAVFLFSLVSPVVFGFIGFIGLSFLIKPALGLLFGVKRTVNAINRKKLLEQRRRERLRNSRRPITIHKHYYKQQKILTPTHPHPHRRPHQHHHHRHRPRSRRHKLLRYAPRQPKHFNPLLPHVKEKLKKDTTIAALFIPNFVRYERITNGN